MNRREQAVKERYEAQGWKVLRNGAPDFLALKVVDGRITEIWAVEVKGPRGRLSYEQGVYKQMFEQAAVPYVVEVVK